jgi:hypothetical protein
MELIERTFQGYFSLLIPLLLGFFLIVSVKRNRLNLFISVLLGQFNKAQFKIAQNNLDEQEMTIMFWSSIFLQGLCFQTILSSFHFNPFWIYLILICLIFLKSTAIKSSRKIFQKDTLFESYYTSFFLMFIHIGWITFPLTLTNILYVNTPFNNSVQNIYIFFLIIVFGYLIYRLLYLVTEAIKEKISYLQIFFYLCTLEILPLVVISYYFFKY